MIRFRNHPDFWWDVLLSMHKQAQMNTNPAADRTLRDEVIRLAEEVRELRREKDQAIEHMNLAESKLAVQIKKTDLLRKEREKDQAVIAHFGSQPRIPTTRVVQEDEAYTAHSRERTGTIRPGSVPRAPTQPRSIFSDHLHNNPKFPDAPVFSGDRTAFDSWKDKVRDKLNNSAAQYPTEYQRIAYIRSRTDGAVYQQIRAQCQPDHPRSFQTAEEVLMTLDKIYGDKNKRARAINELRTLRMGRKTFDDFYVDFARCAAEIGYADDAMIPLLENAISDELVKQVIGLRKPLDYYDLVDFYREIDHQMRDYDKRTATRYRAPRTTTQADRPQGSRPATATPRTGGYIPTTSDRTLLSQHGRCFKCGEHGHRISECNNPQMKEMPRLTARTSSKVNKIDVESDDEATVVEGKDES